MKPDKWRDWLEVVGIFSVVASLVFVGLQMQQAHKISLSQAYQARTTAAAEFNNAFASNPLALSGLRKATEGAEEEITAEEYDSLYRMMIGVMYLYDNAHYQYQVGFVTEEFWMTTRRSLTALMSYPAVNAMIMDRLDYQGRPEFKDVVRSINEELRTR